MPFIAEYKVWHAEELYTTSGRYFLPASDGGHVLVTGLTVTPLLPLHF
jgi:hypothetical protein